MRDLVCACHAVFLQGESTVFSDCITVLHLPNEIQKFQSLGHIKWHKCEPMLLKADIYTCKYTPLYGLPCCIETKQEQSCFGQT